ncbi:importin-7-like, partial [Diaphorina citri]|uniref:Importin-7-like n=1 Tax=Diaphorina citri TaxID=121845 RepID=A0A3Q0JK11_DIACI
MIRDAIVDAVVMAPEVIRVQRAFDYDLIITEVYTVHWVISREVFAQWMEIFRQVAERPVPEHTLTLDEDERADTPWWKCKKSCFCEVFAQWMEIFRQVAERPVPEHTLTLDEDERADTPWWKCKKWALHILSRIFERYGSPGGVVSDYEEFARWYLKTFSAGILDVLLATLAQYRAGHYISPRVMQQALNYLTQAVGHGHCWARLKPHATAIIQEVLFPFLSYTDADEELWSSDPHEQVADILLKKEMYKSQMDKLICTYVFPEFSNPHGHMRARYYFVFVKYKSQMDKLICTYVFPEFSNPHGHMRARCIQPFIELMLERLVREIKISELRTMCLQVVIAALYYNPQCQMDKLICTYVFPEFSNPHGHMRARNFSEIKFQDESILVEAIRLLLNALLHDKELPVKVEAAIAIHMFLNHQKSVVQLIEPQACWTLYNFSEIKFQDESILVSFCSDGWACWTLYNFSEIKFQDESILVEAIRLLLNALLHDKELPVKVEAAIAIQMFLNHQKSVVQLIEPQLVKKMIVELMLERLMREIKTSELRTMCLQVVIAALYYNPQLFFQVMNNLQSKLNAQESVTAHFIKQWILDTDCFLG